MIFKWHQGLIWLSFDVVYENRKSRIDKCIVDTGSATSAIDIDLVKFNYRKPTEIKRLFGIGGGTQEVVSQTIDAITIDNTKLENINIEFGDFYEDLGVNGFIGNDILSLFTINIDYFNKEIDFKKQL
jgi:hypothetical protein